MESTKKKGESHNDNHWEGCSKAFNAHLWRVDLIFMVIIDLQILNQDFDDSIIYYLNLLFKIKILLTNILMLFKFFILIFTTLLT